MITGWSCPGLPSGRACGTPLAPMADMGPRVANLRLCVSCRADAVACAEWWNASSHPLNGDDGGKETSG